MASVSKVDIANMALAHVGSSEFIESFEDTGAQGRLIRLFYDIARRRTLEDFDWSFARKRLALSESADDPPDEWSYRYQLPSDLLACRLLENPAGPEAEAVPFEQSGNVDGDGVTLLTDLEDAVLIYTQDLETVSMFSPSFVTAFTYLLAHYLAKPTSGKDATRQTLMQAYQFELRRAAAHNANQSRDRAPPQASHIRARD